MALSRRGLILGAVSALGTVAPRGAARAEPATVAQLTTKSKLALAALYGTRPKTRELARKARGILVFPSIVKAGLVVGGQEGEGAMLQQGRATAFYRIAAASLGVQAGMQTFSYALFFMNDKAMKHLAQNDGWSIGSGPTVAIIDKGFAKPLNTMTLRHDVYAFPFSQKGLMAGVGLEGTRITRINPPR
ncbi:MAG: YSC84-related protein [Acetobacteraceae bacterium]